MPGTGKTLHVYMLIKCLDEQCGEGMRFLISGREYSKDHTIRLITNESMKDKISLS